MVRAQNHDITALLGEVGIHLRKNASLQITPAMSGLEKNYRNDWLHVGVHALYRVARTTNFRSIACVGSGNGIDAIAASYLFEPQALYVTDILPELLQPIKNNVAQNVSPACAARVSYVAGRDCAPLPSGLDIIYANLPLIMVDGEALSRQRATTTLTDSAAYKHLCEGDSDILATWSLLSQLGFLRSAAMKLAADGRIITLLGGRVPTDAIDECFRRAGLQYTPVCHGVMRQSDPEYLREYVQREERIGENFLFYDERAAKRLLEKHGLQYPGIINSCSDVIVRELLQPACISAREAYTLYLAGKHSSHTSYAFEAKKRPHVGINNATLTPAAFTVPAHTTPLAVRL